MIIICHLFPVLHYKHINEYIYGKYNNYLYTLHLDYSQHIYLYIVGIY